MERLVTRKKLNSVFLQCIIMEGIERATVEWFNSRSAKDANLSRPILQKKALDFARKSGSDYNPSMSFIARILKKEEISTKNRCGEAGSADLPAKESWLENTWPKLCELYDAKDIFNADESGLQYRLLPKKTLARKGDNRMGTKRIMERITVMFTCSMEGEK